MRQDATAVNLPELTKCDLERRRRPAELVAWLSEIRDEFRETREGRDAMRRRDRPWLKELVDEIWPLAGYAKLFLLDESAVWLQPVIGNQPYDVLVTDDAGNLLRRLEVTQALYGEAGYQERLQREHLADHGHAPVTGVRLRREMKTRAIPKTFGEAELTRARVARRLDEIADAVRAKSEKSYGPEVGLLVEFRGDVFRDENAQSQVDELARSSLVPMAKQFCELALVDDAWQFGFRYDLG
jgi:hypothetical protein